MLLKLGLTILSKMSHRDGPPPVFEGHYFPYWKIRMEVYLEALDVGVLRAASQGFPTPKDPANLKVMRFTTRSGMQRLETLSLEAFARMSLTMCGTTKTPIHYGRTFVHSMKEPRVRVRNAIIL